MVKNPSQRLFILLASSIFAGEFLIMVVFKWLHPNISFAATALLDASLLLIISAILLQRYLIKPITKLVEGFQDAKDELRINAQAFETEEGIIISDPQFKIIRVNKAFEKITGFKASFVLGKHIKEFNHHAHNQELYQEILNQIAIKGSWSGESTGIRVDGQEFPSQMSISEVRNANGKLTEYVTIFSDITHKKEYEEKLHRLAYFDSVSNLPNRELLLIDIEKSFDRSEQSNQYGTLIVLESDNFRILTESNSYLMGDLFLAKISARLKNEIPSNYRIYRIHGNEFALLLEDLGSNLTLVKKNVEFITNIIDSIFSSPFTLNDYEHHSTVSVGIVMFLGHQFTIKHLLKAAEVSLGQASNTEGNSILFYDKTYAANQEKNARLSNELYQAVSKKEITFHYQVQLDRQRKPIGVEALARWNHPTLGMLSPTEFIPIAEQSLMIEEIGNYLLEVACQQLLAWRDHEKTKHLTLSVNVTAKQFHRPEFANTIMDLLARYPIDPTKLTLELTESISVINLDYVSDRMKHLKNKHHIRLSLDDFGTGYSSLSYLQHMPFDEIKIDQSFVRNITSDGNDRSLVKAIIALAEIYEFEVVAEGVETEAQFEFLQEMGCDVYQGYLFSKPLPIEAFTDLINRF